MSASKHTRRPWKYILDTCAECSREGTAEFIISGPPGGSHGQFSREADARLIAAAPDLLEALKAVDQQTFCDCLQSDGSQIENERTRHEPGCWVPLLRSAIAKATTP